MSKGAVYLFQFIIECNVKCGLSDFWRFRFKSYFNITLTNQYSFKLIWGGGDNMSGLKKIMEPLQSTCIFYATCILGNYDLLHDIY